MKILNRFAVKIRLNLLGIKNYKINDDMSIDVKGDVYLTSSYLPFLPIKFNKVEGDFACDYSNFFSLKGCPKEVTGSFSCTYTHIRSLEGGLLITGESYNCNHIASLKSLKGCPKKVGKNFIFYWTGVSSLEHMPDEVDGIIYANNKLTTLENLKTKNYTNFSFHNKSRKLKGEENFYIDEHDVSFSYKERQAFLLKDSLSDSLSDIKPQKMKKL